MLDSSRHRFKRIRKTYHFLSVFRKELSLLIIFTILDSNHHHLLWLIKKILCFTSICSKIVTAFLASKCGILIIYLRVSKRSHFLSVFGKEFSFLIKCWIHLTLDRLLKTQRAHLPSKGIAPFTLLVCCAPKASLEIGQVCCL